MSLGFGQIIIIVIVILLIFGASRLPRIAEDLAKGMKAFKKGLSDDDTTPDAGATAPSHPIRALPARTIKPAKKAAKLAVKAKKSAPKSVASKTSASKTVSAQSNAVVKTTKTPTSKKAPNKKAPSKKSGKHV